MGVERRIARNTISLAAAYLTGQVMTLLLSVFLARYLGEEGYGVWVYAFALTGLVFIVADFGLNTLLVVEVAREKSIAPRYVTTTLLLRGVLGGLCILILAAAVLVGSYPSEAAFVIMVVAASTFLGSLISVFHGMFNAFERMHYNLIVQIIERSFTITIAIALLLAGFGLVQVVLVIFAGSILSFVVSSAIFRTKIAKPSREVTLGEAKDQLRRALHYATTSILLTLLYTLNTVLVQVWGGNAAAAFYGIAYNLAIPLTLLHTFFLGAIFPITSQMYVKSFETLKMMQQKAMKFLFFFGLPMTVGGFLLGGNIILFLYGEEYAPGIAAFQLLVLVVAIKSIGGNIGNILAAANLMRLNTYTVAVATVVNLVGCLIFIPPYGPTGGAAAFFLANLAIGILQLYYLRTRLFKVDYGDVVLKIAIATAVMALVLVLVMDMVHVLVAIGIGAAIYFAVSFLIGALDKGDRDIIMKVFRK